MNQVELGIIWVAALIAVIATSTAGIWMWWAFFTGVMVVTAVMLIGQIIRA